jgi:hypothetical protein
VLGFASADVDIAPKPGAFNARLSTIPELPTQRVLVRERKDDSSCCQYPKQLGFQTDERVRKDLMETTFGSIYRASRG